MCVSFLSSTIRINKYEMTTNALYIGVETTLNLTEVGSLINFPCYYFHTLQILISTTTDMNHLSFN
jgi:hypothetical protein